MLGGLRHHRAYAGARRWQHDLQPEGHECHDAMEMLLSLFRWMSHRTGDADVLGGVFVNV